MAEVDFGGSKVKKIVEAAQEASEAAQELSYRLATTGSGMFEQALETLNTLAEFGVFEIVETVA